MTLALVGLVSVVLAGVPGPSAVILGGGLALSSTAVAMQVQLDCAGLYGYAFAHLCHADMHVCCAMTAMVGPLL